MIDLHTPEELRAFTDICAKRTNMFKIDLFEKLEQHLLNCCNLSKISSKDSIFKNRRNRVALSSLLLGIDEYGTKLSEKDCEKLLTDLYENSIIFKSYTNLVTIRHKNSRLNFTEDIKKPLINYLALAKINTINTIGREPIFSNRFFLHFGGKRQC